MLRLISFLVLMCFFASAKAAKIQLALNWKAEPEFGGFYAAQIGGHFRKRGLEVEITQGGSGTPTVQMLAAGKIDYGIVSADEIVIARSRGADVVAIFAAYQTNPQGLMAHAERGFANIAEVLAGEGTLAIQKGLPYAQFLLNKHKNVKAKVVPYAGGVGPFLADSKYSQQCFVTSEPLEAAKKGVKVRTFLVADEGYNPYTTVLATRGEVFKKNAKQVKDMVEAVRAGWREYIAKPEEANRLMADLNKAMDASTFRETAHAQIALLESPDTKANGLGHMTETRWQELTQQLVQLKSVEKAPDAKAMFVNP